MHLVTRILQGAVLTFGLFWGLSHDRDGSVGSSALPIVSDGMQGLHRAHGVQFRFGEPFTGVLRHAADGISVWTSFVDGRKDGKEIGRFADGSMAFERTWSAGLRQGTALFWWPDGTLKERTAYRDDLPEGLSERWFADGTPAQRFNYRSGQEEGPQMMWYEDGTIRAAYAVRNGRRYGTNGTKGCTTTED
jgi:hypothetical protein